MDSLMVKKSHFNRISDVENFTEPKPEPLAPGIGFEFSIDQDQERIQHALRRGISRPPPDRKHSRARIRRYVS